MTMYTKPLNAKAYGSIPHLKGSKPSTGEHRITDGQSRICCEQCRRGDVITVQEKLDGSCCAVANVDGALLPLTRAGNLAWESSYLQHRLFALWASVNQERFDFLNPGERLVGEWLAQAHGTLYNLKGLDPFVTFDIMTGTYRLPYAKFYRRVVDQFRVPRLLFHGPKACSIERALKSLDCCDRDYRPEGIIWRVEHAGCVDFLCKFVRDTYIPGRYLPCYSGEGPVWNMSPEEIYALCD